PRARLASRPRVAARRAGRRARAARRTRSESSDRRETGSRRGSRDTRGPAPCARPWPAPGRAARRRRPGAGGTRCCALRRDRRRAVWRRARRAASGAGWTYAREAPLPEADQGAGARAWLAYADSVSIPPRTGPCFCAAANSPFVPGCMAWSCVARQTRGQPSSPRPQRWAAFNGTPLSKLIFNTIMVRSSEVSDLSGRIGNLEPWLGCARVPKVVDLVRHLRESQTCPERLR